MTLNDALRSVSLSLYTNDGVPTRTLRKMFEQLDAEYISVAELEELTDRVKALEKALEEGSGSGQENVIEAITVNGAPVPPEGKTVHLEIPETVAELEDSGNYVRKDEMKEYGALSEAEKEKLDHLPQFTDSPGPNGVHVTEDGKLEVDSVTPDRIRTEGYTMILNGGNAAP